MELQPQIICVSHLLIFEKFKTVLYEILRPFVLVGHKIAFKFDQIKNSIKDKFHRWYYNFYQNKYTNFMLHLKKKMRLVALLEILVVLTFLILGFFFNSVPTVKTGRFISLMVTGGTIGFDFAFYYFLKWFVRHYHFYYGDENNHEMDREYTKQYVINYAPRIAKTHGDTGKGKDETNAGLATMFVEGFKEDIAKQKSKIKEICYIFDWEKVDLVVSENVDLFFSSSTKVTKQNFMDLCADYGYFIKFVYRYRININQFIDDCKALKNNVLYQADYIYDEGGLNKKHFLNMLYDYVMLSVREYENRFIFSNQPFIEDMDLQQTAAHFSLNYEITRKQKDRKFNEKNELGQPIEVEYTEKVQFPFKDYLGFLETEVGTWYVNLDKKLTAMLLDLGIRDFKAFNRHMFPHFFWLQCDQDPYRVSKLFRELDHYYIYPDTRIVYAGGEGVNFFIKKKLEYLTSKLEKIYKRYSKYQNRETRYDRKIRRYNRYWIASSNIKYKNKMNDLKESRKVFNIDKETKQLRVDIYNLFQEMTLNIYNHSYIEKIITIGKEAVRCNGEHVYTPKDIIENPDIIKSTYSVKVTFRLSDCWRYNTHCMQNIGNNRAEESELTLMDASTWSLDLNIKPDDIIKLAYVQGAALTGIPVDDIIKTRYKRKNATF